MKYYVYRHIRLDTLEPFYVGKGSGDRYKSTQCRNKYWHNIVKKHGYKVQIVKKFENESDAFAFEKKLILLYKLYNLKLCNLTDGGEGFSGLIFTEEHKNKISMANKGKRSWMKGKNHSKISKKKMSKAKKGKPAHENTKRALIKANTGKAGTMTGRSHSNKAKLKMSEKRKGHLNPASKKVILTTENRVFNTIKECADYLNVSNVTLSRHLNKSSLKYNVEYLNG